MRYSTRTILYDGMYATDTPEYSSWLNMINRCRKDYKQSEFYSDKGIKVCARWTGENAFLNFYEDMGKRPTPQHTLDRIDNDGDYTPENCRWATKREQAINRKVYDTNSSGYRGVSWYKQTGKWRVGIDKITVGYFEDIEEAALAYDCSAIQLHGEFARTNILETV